MVATAAPRGDFDDSAAMLRAETAHLDATLHALATRLAAVPGLKLTVSARQGLLRRLIGDIPYVNDLQRRTSPIERLEVEIGATSYWLCVSHGSIKCGREPSPTQPGPVDEQLSFAGWATALFDEIAEQNLVNHESMVALRRLVEQNRVN